MRKALMLGLIGSFTLGLTSCQLSGLINPAPTVNEADSDKATVSFYYLDGGKILKSKKISFLKGNNLILNDYNEVIEGYDFVGWYSDKRCTSEISSEDVYIGSSVSIYAKYQEKVPEPVLKKVTFKVVSINGTATLDMDEGKYIKLSEYVPQKNGYDFVGWYSDPEYKNPITKDFIIKEDTTIYAKMEQKAVSLMVESVIIINGSPERVVRNSYYTRPSEMVSLSNYTPSIEGFTFEGFYSDRALTKKINDDYISINETTQIYAKLKVKEPKIKANITFIEPGGSSNTQEVPLDNGIAKVELFDFYKNTLELVYGASEVKFYELDEYGKYVPVDTVLLTADKTYYTSRAYEGGGLLTRTMAGYDSLILSSAWKSLGGSKGEINDEIVTGLNIKKSFKKDLGYNMSTEITGIFENTRCNIKATRDGQRFKAEFRIKSTDFKFLGLETLVFGKNYTTKDFEPTKFEATSETVIVVEGTFESPDSVRLESNTKYQFNATLVNKKKPNETISFDISERIITNQNSARVSNRSNIVGDLGMIKINSNSVMGCKDIAPITLFKFVVDDEHLCLNLNFEYIRWICKEIEA